MRKQLLTLLFSIVCVTIQAQEYFFREDSAIIRGRIINYSPTMDFRYLSTTIADVFKDSISIETTKINADGTFEKHFFLQHPIFNWFYTSQDYMGSQQIPFYLCPGDTLNINVRFDDGMIPECDYRGGHAVDVARLLKVRNNVISLQKNCNSFAGDIDEFNHFADSLYSVQTSEINKQADRLHYTSFERRLALCDFASNWGYAYLSYFKKARDKIIGKDSTALFKIGSAEMERLSKTETYPLLKRLPNADSLMFATRFFPNYFNHLRWSTPMRYPLYTKRGIVWENTIENVIEELSIYRDTAQHLFASSEDTILAQLIYLNCLNIVAIDWLNEGNACEYFYNVGSFLTYPVIDEMSKKLYDIIEDEEDLIDTLPEE